MTRPITVISSEAAKSAYPVTVASATFMGLALQDWVYVTAIVYALLQSGFLVWKWIRDWRLARRAAKRIKPTVPDPE